MLTAARLTTVLALLVTMSTSAQTAPDFSGRWKLDPARATATGGGTGRGTGGGTGGGGGLGLGPSPDQLMIRQSPASLTIEERRGTSTSRVTYALDGKKQSNRITSGRGTGGSATSVSAWKDARLVTTITAPGAPGTRQTIQYE